MYRLETMAPFVCLGIHNATVQCYRILALQSVQPLRMPVHKYFSFFSTGYELQYPAHARAHGHCYASHLRHKLYFVRYTHLVIKTCLNIISNLAQSFQRAKAERQSL